MATKTYTFTNVAGVRKAFRTLPKELKAEVRDASTDISRDIAAKTATRARSVGGVMLYVAPTVKARRGDEPKVVMGGMARLPARGGRPRSGKNQTVGNVVWGGEFGGGRSARTRQFSPWRGNKEGAGYALWPTVRGESLAIMDAYGDALLGAVDRAARRTDG